MSTPFDYVVPKQSEVRVHRSGDSVVFSRDYEDWERESSSMPMTIEIEIPWPSLQALVAHLRKLMKEAR